MSHLVGKPTMSFPNRSDTNRSVQSQKIARILKFRIQVEEKLYYQSSENKGADQLRRRLIYIFNSMIIIRCRTSSLSQAPVESS